MFINQYNICLTNIILDDYECAYQVLKEAKPSNEKEKILYYQKLVEIVLKLGYRQEGYRLCEKIIFSNYSWDLKNEFINHQSKFILSLNKKWIKNLNCITPEYYSVSSPSILPKEDGYLCNLR